jgi:RimJ/RimL family protein N-acetyltransferase
MSRIDRKQIVLMNGINVEIRTAEPKDADGIFDVMKSVMKEKVFTLHETDEYRETAKTIVQKIKKFRNAPGKIIISALFGNRIIGYATFNNRDLRKIKHTGYLTIFIKKKLRGKGLGEELMKILIQWGIANKLIRKMTLAVFSNNKNAIALYEKIGFKIEGICSKDVKINGRYYDSVLMYKFVN